MLSLRHPVARRVAAVTTGLAMAAGFLLVSSPADASAARHHHRSLAAVLTSDGNKFDHNSHDFDIVTQAVLAVLKAKPSSPVSVLTHGKTRVTAFVPTDQAFRALVFDLTGKWLKKESNVFAVVASLGIDTVETVLLYHVVPGATITGRAALRSDGAALTTAAGPAITVDVICRHWVTLKDADTNDRNPTVVAFDINKGNKQIAHAINRVLRPVDLP